MRTFKSVVFTLFVFVSLIATSMSFIVPRDVEAKSTQDLPIVIKSTLHVRAWRMLRYWKQPNADNFWSWMPGLEFQAYGTIPDSGFFTIDYTMPDGKIWFSADVTPQIAAGNLTAYAQSPRPVGHDDKRGILDVGTFGFKIRFRNGITGLDQEIYKGRFKVNKFHVGNNLPDFKNQFEYYVEQDWNLPIGYIWLDYVADKDAPPLKVAMWFRGENSDTNLAAYVYYNGKQIASTKSSSTGAANNDKSLLTSGNDKDPRWERWVFSWYNVRGYNTDANKKFTDTHFLYGNSGNYEIKILCDGDLVRTATFTVGQDGRIVDNGIASQNKVAAYITVLPVKVLGTKDGNWDTKAWKTDAFYGNPLIGFVAP